MTEPFEYEEEVATPLDPFHKDNVQGVQLIVLMRIYDTQMALLSEANPEAAAALHNLHTQGKVLGALPYLDMSEADDDLDAGDYYYPSGEQE